MKQNKSLLPVSLTPTLSGAGRRLSQTKQAIYKVLPAIRIGMEHEGGFHHRCLLMLCYTARASSSPSSGSLPGAPAVSGDSSVFPMVGSGGWQGRGIGTKKAVSVLNLPPFVCIIRLHYSPCISSSLSPVTCEMILTATPSFFKFRALSLFSSSLPSSLPSSRSVYILSLSMTILSRCR